MKLSTVAASAVLALAASSSFAVNITQPITLTNGSGTFGVTHTNDTFTDTFNFLVASASNVSSSIVSINLGAQDVSFTSVTLNGTAFTSNMSGPVELRTLTGLSLAAGSYSINVAGTSVGTGSYAGTLNVSPVPEPQTYALMLAGFAAIGFVAARRKQS